jgi:hypothetical protein
MWGGLSRSGFSRISPVLAGTLVGVDLKNHGQWTGQRRVARCDGGPAPARRRTDDLIEARGFAPLKELSSYYSLGHWDPDLRETVFKHLRKDDSFFDGIWEKAASRLIDLHARGEADERKWREEAIGKGKGDQQELNGMNCVFLKNVFREFGIPIGESPGFWENITTGPEPLGPAPALGMWRALREDELEKQERVKSSRKFEAFEDEPVVLRTKPPKFIDRTDLHRVYDSVKKKLIDTGKLRKTGTKPGVRPVSSFCVRQGEERDMGSYRDTQGGEHFLGVCPEKLRWVLDYRIVNSYIKTSEKIRLLGTETVIEILERMLTHENRAPPLPSRRQVRIAAARHLELIGECARAQKMMGALTAPLGDVGHEDQREVEAAARPGAVPGGSGSEVVMGKLDFSGWYWQFVCRDPSKNIVDIYNPYSEEYEFYEARVLLFGSLVSVFWPVGMSEALMRLLWKLSVIAVIYVDDTILPSFRNRAEKQRSLALLLFKLCGIKMSDEKDESLTVQESLTVLGVAYRLARGPGRSGLIMSAPEARISKTVRLIGDLRLEAVRGKASLKKVLSLYGTMQSLNIFRRARTGVARFEALKPWTDKNFLMSRRRSHKEILVAALNDIEAMVKALQPVLLGAASDKHTVISVTDASLEGPAKALDVEKVPRIGGLARTSDGFRPAWAHCFKTTDRCFWAEMLPSKRSHIGIWEALAVLVQLLVEPEVFEGSYTLFWIDNMADVFSLTRGSSKCIVVDSIVAVIIEYLDANGADFWARWFSSEKNVSDCATRLEKMAILEEIGISVEEDTDPVLRAVNHALDLVKARIRRTIDGPRRAMEVWEADRAQRVEGSTRGGGKKRARGRSDSGAEDPGRGERAISGEGDKGGLRDEGGRKRRRRGKRSGRGGRMEEEAGGDRSRRVADGRSSRGGEMRVPEFLSGMAEERLCGIDSAIKALADSMCSGMVLGQ